MLFIHCYYSICYYLNERLSNALSLYRQAKGGLFTPSNIFQKTKRVNIIIKYILKNKKKLLKLRNIF